MTTGYGWTQLESLTIPNAGSVDFTLSPSRPVLEKLSIWALSGARSLAAGLTFQLRLNGQPIGAAVAPGAGVLAEAVVQDVVGSATENWIIPPSRNTDAVNLASGFDPFVLTVSVANATGAEVKVTMVASAIGRGG